MNKNTVDLSLCMIVKNEEKFLGKCLQNICRHVREIVIVDTGSGDRTKEIARQFTKCVYDFTWCGDFAAARNFSLSKASNDWVLVLDADEMVSEFSPRNVSGFIRKNPPAVGRIKLVNHFEDQWGKRTVTERINRVFNRRNFHYRGLIHEQVSRWEEPFYDFQAAPVDITAEHLGYSGEEVDVKAKMERNAALLEKAIADSPNDPYFHYQLGKTYFWAKDYAGACRSFRQALALPVDFAYEYVADLIESYGYALINSKNYSAALEIESYAKYFRDSPDYLFLLGHVYLNNALFEKAVKTFLECTGKKEGKGGGVNSYLAFYNIGVIHEILGLKKEAAEYYKKCGAFQPAEKRLALLK